MGMRLLVCRSIQPERLNAEGDSPSALSRGLSVSATPGIPTTPKEKRLNDAKAAVQHYPLNICEICVRFSHLRHVIGGCRDII